MEADATADLDSLKLLVQAINPATRLENLSAALIGDLIGVSVTVAKAGFQHGGDAGTVGRQERFLRIECKRYRDDTSLNDRMLLGELDQAVEADPALEAWTLVTTRELNEQLERQLFEKGNRLGIAVIVIDWKSYDTPALAALLASNPASTSSMLGPEAGALAAKLRPYLNAAIERLGRDFAAWHVGTEVMRRRTFERLSSIWESPRQSQAYFGQNVSGGAKHHIHRPEILRKLDEWWASSAATASPACVIGLFGVGKTWVVIDWLIGRAEQLPATLLVPASAAAGQGLRTVYDVKTFIAQRLHEVMAVRDVAHWRARLERMLLRPQAESPALLIVLDGMNQQPSAAWDSLLKVMQGAEFVGRVRVIATTRTLHFEVRLGRLAGLVDHAVPIEVREYDDKPMGEFDQMLALYGLTRGDLHPDLHAIAQNPRLFELVVRFREQLGDAGAVTLHRLLWEYGRDTAGASERRAFSPQEWADWLRVAAERIQEGIRAYSLNDLSEMAARRDLQTDEIYQRMSELADSSFVTQLADGTVELTAPLVAHALGATLVHLLSGDASAGREALGSELEQWLDPISGLDQRPEILRAAVSIALESGAPSTLLGVITAAWLQTQNLAEAHHAEVMALAAEMPSALLDAIELSHRYNHAASRQTAVQALRGIDRENVSVRALIFSRAEQWLRRISRNVEVRPKNEREAEARRKNRFIERIGFDQSGPRMLLGQPMVLIDRDDDQWTDHLPALVEGYPLADLVPALRIAAIATAIGITHHRAWEQLRWVCLLNPVDPRALASAVREAANQMATTVPEAGAHPQLALRAAELLLFISGLEEDRQAAAALNVTMGRQVFYDQHYLQDPGRSLFFPLERRHAEAVLLDETIPLRVRIKRCAELWFDPTFEPPAVFRQAVVDAAKEFPVDRLYVGRFSTREDLDFEELQPVLARCAPQTLADLHRKLVSAAPATGESRVARARHHNDALLLHGQAEVAAARALRTAGRDPRKGEETYFATQLLIAELTALDALAQAVLVVEADLPAIPTTITEDLHPLSTEQVDRLIERFQSGSSKQHRDVLVLLITRPPTLGASAWEWVLEKTHSSDDIARRLALMTLAAADPYRLGLHLERTGWSFTPGDDTFATHAASGALMEATCGQSFEQIGVRLPPWRLLEAVRLRGNDPAEARIAIDLLDAVLIGGPHEAPDPGAQLSVERDANSAWPAWYSVEPIPSDDPHSVDAITHALDEKAQREAQKRASETARARIQKARDEGAGLYLEFVTLDDAGAILEHAPDVLDRWVAGYTTLSGEFVRRVQLAEGLFLAIVEVLLTEDPSRGVALWRAVGQAMRTRVTGTAQLPELWHMLFRAPESKDVLAAREDLWSLDSAHTDAQLYELSLVAQLNGCRPWLDSFIARDLASDVPWRHQRAAVMRGFFTDNLLPVPQAWPDGESTSWAQDLQCGAARLQYLEACARHWWQEYWRCEDLEQAFAAWVLFEQCADRRAMCWMHGDASEATLDSNLRAVKQRHWKVNRIRWRHGAEASSLSLQRRFLRRPIEEMVWPWRK